MTTSDSFFTASGSSPPGDSADPAPLPPELVEALAGILADALVADIRQYPNLAELQANHEPTVESPSGHDRNVACMAPKSTPAPGVEDPPAVRIRRPATRESSRSTPRPASTNPTQEKRAVHACLGWSSATAQKIQKFDKEASVIRRVPVSFQPFRALASPLRLRVTTDAEGFPMFPGHYGRIEWFDGQDLTVYCDHARLFVKIWSIPGVRRHQTGDREMRALFPPEALEQVAHLIRAKRWGGSGRGRPQNLVPDAGQTGTSAA